MQGNRKQPNCSSIGASPLGPLERRGKDLVSDMVLLLQYRQDRMCPFEILAIFSQNVCGDQAPEVLHSPFFEWLTVSLSGSIHSLKWFFLLLILHKVFTWMAILFHSTNVGNANNNFVFTKCYLAQVVYEVFSCLATYQLDRGETIRVSLITVLATSVFVSKVFAYYSTNKNFAFLIAPTSFQAQTKPENQSS